MNSRTTRLWTAATAILLLSACTKIETTELGSDLIPVVDNVKTFETVLNVVANNYLDTLTYRLSADNPHVVGAISADPAFGTSTASMFFQMVPTFPFKFAADSLTGNSKVGFDSAVLILNYTGFYGDSVTPVTFNLYQADQALLPDSLVTPNYTLNPGLTADKSVFWGSKTMSALQFRDTINIKRGDSVYSQVNNQLRIPLDEMLAKHLLFLDSADYRTDTTLRAKMPGFALEAAGNPNTLFYFALGGTSKLEFYYRANPQSAKQDTTSVAFTFNTTAGHAVKFENNHAGSQLEANLIPDPVNGKEKLYIETSPGSYATLSIPGLDTFKLTNRIIHRAELKVVQDEPLTNPVLTAPTALYLDLIDTTRKIYQGIPYDLNPLGIYYCYPANGINFGYFGGISSAENINGESRLVYRFNIARYLQGIVSRKEQLFPLFRLSAPFYMYYEDCSNGGVTYPAKVFPYVQNSSVLNPPGKGRITVAGGSNTTEPAKRMQLRIIYSTL